jgi:hypothetical protein
MAAFCSKPPRLRRLFLKQRPDTTGITDRRSRRNPCS